MFTKDNTETLASIKTRMGWQVALQAGTLVGIANLNSSVKEQTKFITTELKQIQEINIDGFRDIESAVNSLEYSLISGFEDLKWLLGSIDDKLAKIIGLIEFPKATESTEQYLFGLELFRQGFYDKAIKSFQNSIDKNPFNLNANVGLYLCIKSLNKKNDYKILDDIIKLTDSDFTLNTEISKDSKDISIKFFSNFVINELSENDKHKLVIQYYENELTSIAKDELNIRIKYITAKIIEGNDYEEDVRKIINQGKLFYLLCFTNYKINNKFSKFILLCSEIFKSYFEEYVEIELINNNLAIINVATLLIDKLSDNSELLKLAAVKASYSVKSSTLNLFFEKAKNAGGFYKEIENKIKTDEYALNRVSTLDPIISEPQNNKFLKDARSDINIEINNNIKSYIEDNKNFLTRNLDKYKSTLELLERSYPFIESETHQSHKSILRIIDATDINKKSINYNIMFALEDELKFEVEYKKQLTEWKAELKKYEKILTKKGEDPSKDETFIKLNKSITETERIINSNLSNSNKTELLKDLNNKIKNDASKGMPLTTVKEKATKSEDQIKTLSTGLARTYSIDSEDIDEGQILFEASLLVVKHQSGSTSLIQRELKIGYNLAGSIIDQLEAAGIVGPFEGIKERKVLIQSNDELLKEWVTNEHLIKEDSKEFQEALQKVRRDQNK